MAEVYGDPNRQFGIPGIDDQEPGSAAQQAAVDAWKGAYDEGGVDTDAARAAAQRAAQSAAAQYGGYDWNNGRAPNIFNPREAYQAWLRGGAVDYNRMVFEGRPGFQSSNPAIYYGMNEQARAPFGPTYWQGTSLTPGQQKQVTAARAPMAPATPAAAGGISAMSAAPTAPMPSSPGVNPSGGAGWLDPSGVGGMSVQQLFEAQYPETQGYNPYQIWLQQAQQNTAQQTPIPAGATPAAPAGQAAAAGAGEKKARINPFTGELTQPMTDEEWAPIEEKWNEFAAKNEELLNLDKTLKERGMKLDETIAEYDREYKQKMLEFNNAELAARSAMEAARLNIQQQQLRMQMRQRRAPRYAGVRSVY
jgi:hypothetical protein